MMGKNTIDRNHGLYGPSELFLCIEGDSYYFIPKKFNQIAAIFTINIEICFKPPVLCIIPCAFSHG